MVFWDLESKRQSIHLVFGVLFAFIVYMLKPEQSFAFLLGGAALTLLLSLEISEGRKVPVFYWVVRHTERANNKPGSGVTWYFFGVLLTFSIFYFYFNVPKEIIVASMLILAIGDSVCTGLGRKLGRRLLPKTQTKSWAGSGLGFLFSFLGASVPLANIFPPEQTVTIALIGAAVGMLTEAYLRKLNDNLTIPVVSCAAMSLAAYWLGWIAI
ncbi:MAG: hypothetical protein J7L23_00870 [Candidatus Diapherotrites archaeon]|nr:hypothetical protein [Candidatus Diapherotrites archaeon]